MRTPSTRNIASNPANYPRSPIGHFFMFVFMTLPAFALFAPTVLLPCIRSYGELRLEERRLLQRVAELNDEVRRRAELEEAFHSDVIVNERLAVLDLGYRKPNEEVYAVLPVDSLSQTLVPPISMPPRRSALQIPDDWPHWAIQAETWAQERGIIDLFLDESLRPVFLLMAGGLLIAAFVLFAPRIRRPMPIVPFHEEADSSARPVPHAAKHQPA